MKYQTVSAINNLKKLNHKQLNTILTQLGYSTMKVNGKHIVYKHSKPDSLIAIKQARSNAIVPPAVVASVVNNVVNSNVADVNQLEILIQDTI